MTTRTIATSSLLMLLTATTTGLAQSGMGAHHGQAPAMGHMMRMQDISRPPPGPHHVLAMAYRDNLATFAGALHRLARQPGAFPLGPARILGSEMRRSYGELQRHYEEGMEGMDGQSMAAMEGMTKTMLAKMRGIDEQLTALEEELRRDTPDLARIRVHARDILAGSEAMMPMTGMTGKQP